MLALGQDFLQTDFIRIRRMGGPQIDPNNDQIFGGTIRSDHSRCGGRMAVMMNSCGYMIVAIQLWTLYWQVQVHGWNELRSIDIKMPCRSI